MIIAKHSTSISQKLKLDSKNYFFMIKKLSYVIFKILKLIDNF